MDSVSLYTVLYCTVLLLSVDFCVTFSTQEAVPNLHQSLGCRLFGPLCRLLDGSGSGEDLLNLNKSLLEQ